MILPLSVDVFILVIQPDRSTRLRNSPVLLLFVITLHQFAAAQSGARSEKLKLLENERTRGAALIDALTTPPAANDIDVTYYSLDLAIITPPASPLLRGSVFVKAVSLTDTLRHVPLDFSNAMTVDSVVMNGSSMSFGHEFSLLTITLDRTYPTGTLFGFTVFYHGVPDDNGYGSFVFSAHNSIPWVWSLSEPYGARDWWPCKDHPLDKADSVDMRVTCDARFKVGSNGRLVSVTTLGNNLHTYTWSERYPIATYLVSVALTNYVEFSDWFHYSPSDSMQVLNYVLPEHFTTVRPQAARTVDMLTIFSRRFGLYPFVQEKYGHSSFGWGGAMEHQTMTSTTTYDEFVIAHELGHQWFGDLITCASWSELWLNEGFATYSEALYAEAKYGAAAYHDFMRQTLDGAEHAVGPLRSNDTTNLSYLFAPTRVYDKGASVLHMLRHVLGDTVFFTSLQAYTGDQHLRYATAVTEDFRAACERTSGRDLGWFFNEWVDGEGFPGYDYSWSTDSTTGGFQTSVRIVQRAKSTPPALFTMPLDCRFTSGAWDTTVVLQDNALDQQFTMLLSHRPDSARLDPGAWVLGEFTNLNETGTIPRTFALLQNYPNPFNPTTTIPFDLAHQEYVSLKVYDILGREIATLAEGKMFAGHYEIIWNRAENPGRALATGVYLCRLLAGSFSATKKMLLLR
jgi:aminopeptidase N